MRNYLVTGGTGLIGQALIKQLLESHNQVWVLTRNQNKAKSIWKNTRFEDRLTAITHYDEVADEVAIDYVINLAGEPIADKRWSNRQKQKIWQSRIILTEKLVDWLTHRELRPKGLISGSAVGWYGDGADKILTEQSEANDEYTHQLCQAWEQAALKATESGVRVCVIRTGLVVSAQGGFLSKLKLPFQFGLGAKIGNGKQYMPWVHIDDMVKAILFLLAADKVEQPELSGAFNLTAPNPVTNAEFTQTLAAELNRPNFLVAPAFLLKLILGEMSRLLLTGQRAVPQRLTNAGFEFRFKTLQEALSDVLSE
ncbi:TIGR01777 family oxidoreductase [Aliikangiella coralliicola]|uniref:TIGR01777 family protein n=1 Tax=Aliikangiella coralliicola TaxID=2592383 RepID=A0A545UAD5_9GAMM|nr:TIGR01777 family oxidoreductase [Aliikangiella coralliicola]TQV86410.1 TIGR01777 family protein [Aliikangiella coralliicola]